jgi:hypothetical protein
LTGDQKHTAHIATGQRVSRHSSRPDVFYFFSYRTFLKTILASRTSGTFGFARHTSQRFAKPKEPLFSQPTHTLFISINEIYLPIMITFDNQYYFGYEQN